MRRSLGFVLAVLVPALPGAAPAAESPVAATVETTLTSTAGQVRQFAFDGDPDTYFASRQDAGGGDHFTLVFDSPVTVKSLAVTTGRPEGGDALDAGTLEVSADGEKFEQVARFAGRAALGLPAGTRVKAVRIRPAADLKHPLAVREIAVESDPAVAVFKYPIEFVVNVDDAPEMKDWAEKAAHICERAYPMICEELKSDGFRPRSVITMTLRKNYRGVAATGGGRITGSVKYFQDHADDFGAMVHETVHAVQDYRRGGNPGWLVEGIADYIRFFKYEPAKPLAALAAASVGLSGSPSGEGPLLTLPRLVPGRLPGTPRPTRAERAHYDGSYRVTAAFLAFVTEKYDRELVRKLNAVMRAGKYRDEVFQELTGKTLQQLDDEWRASLPR
jgi:hypothetical protein